MESFGSVSQSAWESRTAGGATGPAKLLADSEAAGIVIPLAVVWAGYLVGWYGATMLRGPGIGFTDLLLPQRVGKVDAWLTTPVASSGGSSDNSTAAQLATPGITDPTAGGLATPGVTDPSARGLATPGLFPPKQTAPVVPPAPTTSPGV